MQVCEVEAPISFLFPQPTSKSMFSHGFVSNLAGRSDHRFMVCLSTAKICLQGMCVRMKCLQVQLPSDKSTVYGKQKKALQAAKFRNPFEAAPVALNERSMVASDIGTV